MNSDLLAQLQSYDLESTLPYLLNRAGVKIGTAFSQDIARFDMSLPVWRILASLCHQDQQRLTELADHTSIEVSTLSRLVSACHKDGLLSRRRSGADGRSVTISITNEGREQAARIIPIAQLYERIALAGIPAEEVALLKRLLARVYVNIAALGVMPEPVATKRASRKRRAAPRRAARGVRK